MTPRLSIITGIHNGLAMNELFWESLSKNTLVPFEWIVVDNHSTDGSQHFLQQLAVVSPPERRVIHIRNEKNQCYPVTQNQGVRYATGDILCFLNNDLWLPRRWHEPLLKAIEENPDRVVSPACQEAQPSQTASRHLKGRWKICLAVSRGIQKVLFLRDRDRLALALHLMYGNLDSFFNPTRTTQEMIDGINGSAVCFHRQLLTKGFQIWDERFESADWHLYLTLAAHHEKDKNFPLPKIVLSTYVHHFGRFTRTVLREPYPKESILPIEKFWSKDDIKRLWWGNHLQA